MPSTPYDAKGLLKAAIRGEDPVIFFEPKRLYRASKGEVPGHDYTVKIGEAAIRREGTDLSLIGYGGVMPDLERAADALAAEGVSVEVIDLRSLVPWDRELVVSSVQKTGRAVLVSEAPRISNFMGEVAYVIQDAGLRLAAGPGRSGGGLRHALSLRAGQGLSARPQPHHGGLRAGPELLTLPGCVHLLCWGP